MIPEDPGGLDDPLAEVDETFVEADETSLESEEASPESDGAETGLVASPDALPAGPSLFSRLRRLFSAPLWTEDASYKARRRCRTMIATPFAAIAGIAWGALAGPGLAGGAALWAPLGAFSFAFFIYLEQRLMPVLSSVVSSVWPRAGHGAGMLWEAAVVGGLFYMLTSVLGAPLVPAVGTALGIGAFYTVLMEYVICGSAASNIAALVQGPAGTVRRVSDGFSHADALVQQGRFNEAAEIYRSAIAADGRDATPYVRLARVRVRQGEPEAAIHTLRTALERARLEQDQEGFVVRQIYEVCAGKLHDPAEAIDDLRRLLDNQPRSKHATWARWTLREIEDPTEA